jgi:drug/metabolite transporter (DMT)-like permease
MKRVIFMANKAKADIALLIVTLFWGVSFLLTKNSLASLEVFNFLSIRFLIAFLFSAIIFYKRIIKSEIKTIVLGFVIGFLLFLSYAFQTVGLLYTSLSNSAFITGTSVVMVPIIASLLLKQKIKKEIILGVVLSLIGIALLTLKDFSTMINIGDLYTLICAFLFAMYIILVGKYSSSHDSIVFAIWQIGSVGFFSLISSFTLETYTLNIDFTAWLNILFLAVICTSGAFIIQNLAQRYTTSTHTALIYANEPVFAAIFGYIFAGEILGFQGIIGGVLILLGVLVAELDLKNILRSKK